MNAHSLKILEYPKIISLIEGKCLTPFGVSEVQKIRPLKDRETIEHRQDEISQLKDIVNFGDPFPLYRLDDCRELLKKSRLEGSMLEASEILKVLQLVTASIDLTGYDREGRDKFPLIAEYLTATRAFPELRQTIARAIDDTGEIKDNASRQLKEIRSELNASKQKIIRRLEQILSKQTKQAGWQDDIVTLRSDRYVIGIPTHQYRTDMGILHDRSQTGATFYVEPKETVELNNRINILYQEERQEMARILKAITAEIGQRSEALMENARLIGKLDLIHAAALFSNQIKGSRPAIDDSPVFDLKDARHPLLVVQFGSVEKVVPSSIGLDDSRRAILVTGPNTGGKTIALKTIGLTVLMAQSGLHIAADEKSSVGIFKDVFADIGDEQSIELSLSTFSSHIKNIISGLNGAADDVLLLFDEIGAGTDPKEGSALAEAIILHALEKGSRLVATTHYSQLKTLAMEYPQLENASLQFDRETLAPTYQLSLGMPGSSYAVEIAGRLGMPAPICDRASRLLGSEEKSLDKLIASLEQELRQLRQDQLQLSEKLKSAEELEARYRKQTEHLKNEVESEKNRALKQTRDFLEHTRKDIEKLVSDIRKSQASDKSVKGFHRKLRQSEETLRRQMQQSREETAGYDDYKAGDRVEIISLGQQGEIEQLIGRDRARIKVGNVYTTVQLRDLKPADAETAFGKSRSSGVSYTPREESPEREIHLMGMTGEEAIEQVEKFLDQSVVSGLGQVYVVHGKGTGALRRKLTEYLKGHPDVVSVRLGNWNEGGAGVTVVRLKD
ncbi:MAG: endonuclease MutS2 [Candidatus Zixiibacteriota bacterium]|nr:MAG: endonuclease MutS2 [candidate division Zixibacteria bacterium]